MDSDPRTILNTATKLADRLADETYYAAACLRSGVLPPQRALQYGHVARELIRYGLLGGSVAVSSRLNDSHPAVIDELGTLTYGELGRRIDAIATGWLNAGLRAGDGVAIIARNHRGFVEAFFAAAKCGARIVLLNTSFSGPQIVDVAQREGTDLLVYDEEYAPMLAGFAPRLGRWRSFAEAGPDHEGPGVNGAGREARDESLDDLVARTPPQAPPRPERQAKVVILTSGTTGKPKGAGRDVPLSLAPVGALLGKVPFRSRQVMHVSAPLFHSFGFTHMILGVVLSSTLVLQRKFDPARTLESIERHRASALIGVPVMLRRIVDLGPEAWSGRDLSSLRIVFVSGSQLGAELAQRATERLGPVLYNLYGSTEVAFGTIATPSDLAAAPSSVGRAVRGTTIKIFGENGQELGPGQTGRVFVGNPTRFEGYTGGGGKEEIAGLLASGDVGHFDADGRLFIDGRDDEMIISGGENVFPAEIEELLTSHEAVLEAAAIGVKDEEWGQRLRAFIVPQPGTEVSEQEIKDFVRDNLARYKVPRDIVFVDELPRNPTGKILKRELPTD